MIIMRYSLAVIFAADVKVTFDDYRKTMLSTASSKTIFTVNPGSVQVSLFKLIFDRFSVRMYSVPVKIQLKANSVINDSVRQSPYV